jgi:hypothetical protein
MGLTERHWTKGKPFARSGAASLHKPDGLDIIDHANVRDVYQHATLLDLCGINTRFQARLNAYGIFTPTEFFAASLETLKMQVSEAFAATTCIYGCGDGRFTPSIFSGKALGVPTPCKNRPMIIAR